MNRIVLIGRLSHDPSLRFTESQKAVCNCNIAVDRRFSNGEKKADFIDFVCWGATAEAVATHLTKGSQVAVCGSLQIRDWMDKDGNKRKSAEVVADEVQFIGSKQSASAPQERDSGFNGFNNTNDDLPF